MILPNLDFGVEWALLELLCLGIKTPCEQEMLKDIMESTRLQWGELLEQALRHKMLPALAFSTLYSPFKKAIPRFVRIHLRTTLDINIHKTILLRRETGKAIKALNEHAIKFVCTKGITLESTIYEGKGIRYFLDIDFMFDPQDREVVFNTLSKLGYQIGEFDWQKGSLLPKHREIMAAFKLNPDHLPKLIRLIDDPVIRCIYVDVATSLTWTRSSFNVPIKAALAEIVHQPIPGIPDIHLPCFSPKFQFIFTILHLFREAWVFREGWLDTIYHGWDNDVNLSKFADVIRLWRTYQNELNTPDFIQTLEEFQIIDPILWVLEHTDRTFHTGIVPALGLEGRVTEEWLHSAGGVGGKRVQWKGTMRERLHCKDRRQLFLTDT